MFDLSHEEQVLITQKIMRCLNEWGLSAAQQINVLALPEGIRTRKLRTFHQDTPFPQSEDVRCRVAYLLEIIDALRTSYPMNAAMGGYWMNKPHRRLQGKTPVQKILEDGGKGISAVLAELDCTYAWNLKDI